MCALVSSWGRERDARLHTYANVKLDVNGRANVLCGKDNGLESTTDNSCALCRGCALDGATKAGAVAAEGHIKAVHGTHAARLTLLCLAAKLRGAAFVVGAAG